MVCTIHVARMSAREGRQWNAGVVDSSKNGQKIDLGSCKAIRQMVCELGSEPMAAWSVPVCFAHGASDSLVLFTCLLACVVQTVQ